MKRLYLVSMMVLVLLMIGSGVGMANGTWFVTDKGYKIWNPVPVPNEIITWSGDKDKDGYCTGQGILENYQEGKIKEKYEGSMLKGKLHGKGRLTTSKGEFYEGGFIEGEMRGKGKVFIKFDSGNCYEGEVFDSNFQGKGILTLARGGSYEGEFLNGKFHGKGIFIFANTDRYEGDFVDGNIEGYGIKYYHNGWVEEGRWVNNQYVGK